MSDIEPSEFIDDDQRRALELLHGARPHPTETFTAETGDGKRARVEPTKATKKAIKKSAGQTR
ncbi:hypothetical protein AB0E69_20315 [Kribbella sp. NPDC026611]|uniref:hypothetical protein n=1 Tax=Kribbella sp. NPDC026611 TaxID=3154911 RepID=UPI0033FC606E